METSHRSPRARFGHRGAPCLPGWVCFPWSGVGSQAPQAPREVPSLLEHQHPLWEVWRIPCDSLALLMLRAPGHPVSLVCTCGFTRLSPEGTRALQADGSPLGVC